MKIAIIGYSGSGKSTLAKKLSQRYNCPILYLDTVNFEQDWVERDREVAKSMVAAFMENESWVIDGNYIEFYQERRLEEADKIIFMDFPIFTCFFQAYRRKVKARNTTRDSMADGCIEKFDLEFARWIVRDGRTQIKTIRIFLKDWNIYLYTWM
ncbi:MAG: topology modulation protein [Sedimentibacter sp.]|nr:topology modulation protein [Sedimentibacter sp.]